MKPTADLGFIHRFEASSDPVAPPVLLLHGTGGDENDLIPLGQAVAPGSKLLSVRGKVLENGMPRFFRRLAEGVFDLEDLRQRTAELARFIEAAARAYRFDANRVLALGFSNGANIAASLLLSYPDALAGGVLIRPMVPFVPERLPKLSQKKIFVLSGRMDPIVPLGQPDQLADFFRSAGAQVELHWETAGHMLTEGDVAAAKDWVRAVSSQQTTAA